MPAFFIEKTGAYVRCETLLVCEPGRFNSGPQKKHPALRVFILEAWVGMFTSPLATVANRNLIHHAQCFATDGYLCRLRNFACMRTGPVQFRATKKHPALRVFILEAWVGIEPA